MRAFRLLVMLAAASLLTGCVVVEDGTVGISKSFGKISEQSLAPGVYASVPLVREVEVWNVKTQRLTSRIDVPSSEGLIVGIETALLFKPTNVVEIRTKVGSKYVQTVLEASLVNVFREVIGKKKVEEIIKEQETLTTVAAKQLVRSMEIRGIEIEQLLVTGLRLPQNFKEAIERKLEQEQRALQKEFELTQAQKDAQIEVARAKGAAEAQEIVRSTLSPEYLQYLWISTLNQNPNVIYVATEANMPVFRTTPAPKASG